MFSCIKNLVTVVNLTTLSSNKFAIQFIQTAKNLFKQWQSTQRTRKHDTESIYQTTTQLHKHHSRIACSILMHRSVGGHFEFLKSSARLVVLLQSDQTVELLERGELLEVVSARPFLLQHFQRVDQGASRGVNSSGGMQDEVESHLLELLRRVQRREPTFQHVGRPEAIRALAHLPHLVVAPWSLDEASIRPCLHTMVDHGRSGEGKILKACTTMRS